MRVTPAIIGYSLLYPYSDNYLDSKDFEGKKTRIQRALPRPVVWARHRPS